MNLRLIDLNLLVVLDALVEERSVRRTASRIGLSQSATSHALERLRKLLDDELLVRTSTGMEPTPRALELAGPVLRTSGSIRPVSRTALERGSSLPCSHFTLVPLFITTSFAATICQWFSR